MSNTVIAIRSSGVASNTPSLGVLANGEIALNFADGILYYKTDANTLGTIQTTEPSGLNQELQFNDSGSFGANSGLTFDKTTGTLTVSTGLVVNSVDVPTTLTSAYNHANGAFNAANTASTSDYTAVSVTPGTYGNSSAIPSVTVEANGRISSVTTQAFSAATVGDILALSIALG
jgi:hypothetical protein